MDDEYCYVSRYSYSLHNKYTCVRCGKQQIDKINSRMQIVRVNAYKWFHSNELARAMFAKTKLFLFIVYYFANRRIGDGTFIQCAELKINTFLQFALRHLDSDASQIWFSYIRMEKWMLK